MGFTNLIRCAVLAPAALATLVAAEYHGQIKFGGLPLPGVTVVATQGGKTLTAVSDQQGMYSFPDLPDGNWSLQAEKVGFSAAKQEVTVGGNSPGRSFELKMLSLDQMENVHAQTAVPPASSVRPPVASEQPARTPPAKPNAAAAAKPATAYQRTDLNAIAKT